MLHMQSALLVFGVLALAIVLFVAYLITNHTPGHSIYDEIGRGGLLGQDEPRMKPRSGGGEAPPGSDADRLEREREIRQMLGARSERRLARGEPALDLDAETARLLGPELTNGLEEPRDSDGGPPAGERDPGLVEEVRQLVIARNERREGRGLEPLDVEAEVRRTLLDLEG
jgi:hypothetical protein